VRYSAYWLASQPKLVREAYYTSLSRAEIEREVFNWNFWARDNQLYPHRPGMYAVWLILAGRGFGKTRSGAEQVRKDVKKFKRVNLIAATADDARDIMVEGQSGILAICPDDERPRYLKNDRKLIWPTGATSLIFTADEPDRLRGKQHERLWADELAAWRYAEAWDQAMFGLRLGSDPFAYVTTTPRPTPIIKRLVQDETCYVTYGTTYENKANLAKTFYSMIINKYENTRLGRQELLAEILSDNPDALWQRLTIEASRLKAVEVPRDGKIADAVWRRLDLKRVAVAIDPQVSLGGAETGITVCGLGNNGHGYLLHDATVSGTPNEWGTAAVEAYKTYRADRIVAETNQGGKMVEHVIRSIMPNAPYVGVHASKGKQTRAEPVAALYEQGKVHHLGMFATLEDQMCEWTPEAASPDRLDSLVWNLTFLMLEEQKSRRGVGI
jgi:phage terminase large subunit-like protein